MLVAWATRVATLTTIKIQAVPWLRLCSNSCCGTTLAPSWFLGSCLFPLVEPFYEISSGIIIGVRAWLIRLSRSGLSYSKVL